MLQQRYKSLTERRLEAYVGGMDSEEIARLRERLDQYLMRKGHGALTDLAKKTGLHVTTLHRFRNGASVEMGTYEVLARELPDMPALQVVNEAPAPYLPNSPVASIARDLRLLADFLDDPDCPAIFKARKFVAWVEFAHAEIQTLKELLERDSNGPR